MKFLIRKIVLFCFCSILFSFTSVVSAQDYPLIKVMEWNIGSKEAEVYNLTRVDRINRMNSLATVMVENGIEIAFFEEFSNTGNVPVDVDDNSYEGDLFHLLGFLEEKNSPMYANAVKYHPSRGTSHMVVLSKWPLDESTLQTRAIRERSNARVTQSIYTRGTTLGDIRLSNIHTHINYQMRDFVEFVEEYYQFDPQDTLLAGDNNITINSDDIPSRIEDIIEINCRQDPCVKSHFIESIFTFKDSNYFIEQRFPIGNVNGISDQHGAMVALVGTTQPIPTPTPTPVVAACTIRSEPEVECSPDGTQVMITWELTDKTFSSGKTILWMERMEPQGVWQLVSESDPTGDRKITTDLSTMSTSVRVIPGDDYRYRVSAYSDPDDEHLFGICSMNDLLVDGKTRRQRYDEGWREYDDFVIDVNCAAQIVSPDYNQSGSVDIVDYSTLIQVFGIESCQHNLVGESCLIDIQDYSVLITKFGKEG